MSTWQRAVMVVALVAGMSGFGGTSGAQPEGDTTADNVYVTLVLRGTAPDDSTFTVEVPGAVFEHQRVMNFTLADLGPREAQETPIGPEPVFVTDDGGADRVSFACAATDHAHCTVFADRVEYSFDEGFNTQVDVTITLTFGTCDGQPVSTFLADGDTPGPGNDVILGTMAAETINGHGGADRICGQGGNDLIRGGEGRDRLIGGNGADRLEGGALGDDLMGGAGADTLLGLAGNDALDGGAQRDTCNGGTQHDTAVRCEVKASIP